MIDLAFVMLSNLIVTIEYRSQRSSPQDSTQQKVSYVPELFFADLGSGPGARSARYERILVGNIGALMIRIGSWGPLYYDDNKEPLKTGLVIL